MRKMIMIALAAFVATAAVALAGSGDQGRRLTGPICISLKTGVMRSVAATQKCKPGERRASGIAGVAGATGPAGATGAAGAKGDTGATGARGNDGAAGSNGAAGPAGATGAVGATGPAGATGAAGPAGTNGTNGTDGTNNPLVFGPYASGSDDSSICGGNWAHDTYNVTYIVTPASDGSFNVTKLYQGSFLTVAGDSPNDSSCGDPADDVAAGITGAFYGDYALNTGSGVDFNFTATCPAGCSTTDFFNSFFGTSVPANYAWQFHYTTPSNGTWNNTDHGNTGNIN